MWSVSLDKAALRVEARAVRRAIPAEERSRLSDLAAERFLALPELRSAGTVGCYASVGGEVETTLLMRGLLARGVKVAVPVLEGGGMRFVRLQHAWALAPAEGPRKVPEPRQPWEDVDGDALDAVVVPGLRFGRDGSRLGQGGGYFDRFLGAHVRARRVGLAFEAQVVETVETEAHDVGMDVLVTEARVLRFPRRPGPVGSG